MSHFEDDTQNDTSKYKRYFATKHGVQNDTGQLNAQMSHCCPWLRYYPVNTNRCFTLLCVVSYGASKCRLEYHFVCHSSLSKCNKRRLIQCTTTIYRSNVVVFSRFISRFPCFYTLILDKTMRYDIWHYIVQFSGNYQVSGSVLFNNWLWTDKIY